MLIAAVAIIVILLWVISDLQRERDHYKDAFLNMQELAGMYGDLQHLLVRERILRGGRDV